MNKLVSIILDDAKRVIENVDLASLHGKSVLITGASGIIGTYLLATIRAQREKTGNSPMVYAVIQSNPVEHFTELLSFPDVKVFQGDITDEKFLQTLPPVDVVIHAAGYGQPGKFMADPVKTLQINLVPKFLLLNRIAPGGKFLFLSSSEVYSGLPNPPYTEDTIGTTNTTHPRACYIEAKRCGEAICIAYRTKNIDAKSARLSLAYGPGTKHGDARVLNSFIERAIHGDLTLLDEGRAKRTYCYVADAVEILWHILLFGKEPIYNVGGHSKITIRELAEKIGLHLGASVQVPPPLQSGLEGAPEDVSLDMTKVLTEFGKKNFIDINEGLKRTIEWQKELYKK